MPGFAVYRTDQATNKTEPLPAWVGFRGQTNKNWKPQTTEVWPIQKFTWRDLTATRGATYIYTVVPMIGAVGNLAAAKNRALTTGPVSLVPEHANVSAYFNRGILSTQSLAHQVPAGPSGAPNYKVLTNRIDQPGDPLRKQPS